MSTDTASPVFIHSLFRSGSTYIFNAFRRSENGYWCYQEPLSEHVLFNAKKPGGFTAGGMDVHEQLRHPKMDKPYYYEYHVVSDEVLNLFKPGFSYKEYFVSNEQGTNDLLQYFTALIDGAKGRPVFQCCRTAGRVNKLKALAGSSHIFLYRNPWDQWWSYKQDNYFDSRNLAILCEGAIPQFLAALRERFQAPDSTKVGPEALKAYINNKLLTPVGSYMLYYSLWCHAMLSARPASDMEINIDELSTSQAYREKVQAELAKLDITGLDFSDAAVPMTTFGPKDAEFFVGVENLIHEVMAKTFPAEDVEELRQLSVERQKAVVDTTLPENAAVKDAMRAREYSFKMAAKACEIQAELFTTRSQLFGLGQQEKQAAQ